MSSLAKLPDVVGFFSYSRDDDRDSKARLSKLRDAIQRELGSQLGADKRHFRLWQDKEAIALGTLWESKIKEAIDKALFFIPIVTPRAVGSRHCKFEFKSFLERERALGRDDLVFPILYIAVPALDEEEERRSDPVLSIIGKRQYVDWREYRFMDVDTPAFSQEIARFCDNIVKALRKPWVSPEERRQQEEAAALRRAEEERIRQEAEARKRAVEEARRREEEAEAQRRADEERIQREAQAKKREEDEARRRHEEAEAQRKAEEAKRRQEEAAADAARKAEEDRRAKEAAEVTEKAEQARRLAEAEAARRAEEERRAKEADEAKRAAHEAGEKQEAEDAKRLAEAESVRKAQDECRATEAGQAELAAREDRERQEAADPAVRDRLKAEAEAAAAAAALANEREAAEFAAQAAEGVPEPLRSALFTQPMGARNWRLAAIAGAAIVGAILLLVAEFGPRQPSTPIPHPAVTAASPPEEAAQPKQQAVVPIPPSVGTAPSPRDEAVQAKQPDASTTSAMALTAAQERALKAGDSFKECADCPQMIVVPAGTFMMGSPAGQGDDDERPQHKVTIAQPFAVAKFALTFDEWDACAARGDCAAHISDDSWGRGRRPVINVSWEDAQSYVKWLSRITGKTYRLLSEAEYEYAARAGTQTKYPWGDDIKLNGKAMANCDGCGSQWDNKQTAPVGSFAANAFGLYDMVGNVWAWTEDCWNGDYKGTRADGAPWKSGDCCYRVVRGGSWSYVPDDLRSAYRLWVNSDNRDYDLGFRVARTLTP